MPPPRPPGWAFTHPSVHPTIPTSPALFLADSPASGLWGEGWPQLALIPCDWHFLTVLGKDIWSKQLALRYYLPTAAGSVVQPIDSATFPLLHTLPALRPHLDVCAFCREQRQRGLFATEAAACLGGFSIQKGQLAGNQKVLCRPKQVPCVRCTAPWLTSSHLTAHSSAF